MNVLYVYAHPEPRSFNGALRETAMVTFARSGHQVKVSNLYVMKFKAVLDAKDFRIRADPSHFNPAQEQIHGYRTGSLAPDIREEIEKVIWADLLILQFPIWWSFLPAIVKGWIDRVFVQGFVVDIEEGKVYERGLLEGKKGLIVATCGSTEEMYSRSGIHGDLTDHLSPVTHGVFEFTGMESLAPFIVYNVPTLTPAEGERQLERYRTFLESL